MGGLRRLDDDQAEPAHVRPQAGSARVLDDQPVMFVLLFVYVFGGAIQLALPPDIPTSTS
jgi:hypothetical protein